VRDGATVWAETFDERFDDLLSLQDSISERVARALVLNLSRADRLQLTKRHTENAEAYRLYLMGRYVWNRRLGDVLRSREYFRQAVALDPNFALAHVGLADSYSMGPPPQPEAERAVRRALEIDDSLGEAHATLGFILMFQNWDWEGAERELRRAVELSPNYATAHHWLGVYLSLRGRPDEAKAAMRRALEIDPTSLIINADLGQLHYFAGEYEEAEAQCRKALEMDADFPVAHHYLYFVHLKTGRHGEAFEHWLKFHLGQKNVQGDEPSFRSVYAAGGMRAFWRERLDSERSNPQPPPMHMALFHTHLGDREQALRWLDRARERRDFLLPFVNVDPVYDDLRPDPRFREIVRRVGLAE
jgi:Tfp pilus assembly protein PilF